MDCRGRLRAELVDGRTRLTEVLSPAPIALRETPDGVYLVASAQSLVAADALDLEVIVGPGARLRIRSAAATIAYASHGASFRVEAKIAAGGHLEWRPEALIATARCQVSLAARIQLDDGATLDWRDECVLGRCDEAPGALTLSLSVDRAGWPMLRHTLATGDGCSGWDGPAVVGENRAIGQRLMVGASSEGCEGRAGDGWAALPLEGGGILITAVGGDLLALREAMNMAASE